MNSRTSSGTPAADPPPDRAVRWRFADCQLDGRTLELSVRGQLVKLEPKPLDLLMFLLRHAGEVVTKDELQDQIWPGRILSESVLTKAVAKLRQGLGDEDQAIIKTVHGYGYRMIAPVSAEAVEPAVAAPQLGLRAGDHPPLRPHWALVERLGGGGMGEAWLAEHTKTGERRVFKFALDARGLTALKREITLYRVLKDTYGDRPDWVRLLDWNIDEPPYFIEAEYADGGALPDWAEARGGLATVPLAERLELVAQAADSLAAAHAAGVLHKDLKPANLLIARDDQGRPRIRLADFGSGRMMDLARLERLEITRLGFTEALGADEGSSGTPFYFAPELMHGQAPTVQTDLYALGVILYQMAVADLKRPLTAGWEREINDALLREDIALAAASQAGARLGDAAELARRLRTLDARRAQREREIAASAQRVEQQKRQARLLVTRRWSLALAAVLALATASASLLYLRAEDQRRRAEAVNAFVSEDLFAAANPWTALKPDVTVRELLDQAQRRAGERFAGQPEIEAALRTTLGRSYLGVGQFPAAVGELQRALALQPGAERSTNAEAVQIRLLIGEAAASNNDETLASRSFDTLAEDIERERGVDDPAAIEARVRRVELDFQSGREAQSLEQIVSLQPRALAVLGPEHVMTLSLLNLRGWALILLSRPAEAEPFFQQAYDTRLRSLPKDHPDTLGSLQGLAHAAQAQGRLDEAERRYKDLIARRSAVLGREHPLTLTAMNQINSVYDAQGRYADSEKLMSEVVAIKSKVLGETHPSTLVSLCNLATAYTRLGRLSEAEALYRRVHAQERITPGLDDAGSLVTMNYLADVLRRQGRLVEAGRLHEEILVRGQKLLTEDRVELAVFRLFHAETLFDLGRRADAEEELARAAPVITANLPAGHRHRLAADSLGLRLKS